MSGLSCIGGVLSQDFLETLGPTLALLRSLGFYRNMFDTHGNKLGLAGMALLCRKAAFSVVATDSEWTLAKTAGA